MKNKSMYVFSVASTTITDRCPEGRSTIDSSPGSYPTYSFFIMNTLARGNHWIGGIFLCYAVSRHFEYLRLAVYFTVERTDVLDTVLDVTLKPDVLPRRSGRFLLCQ